MLEKRMCQGPMGAVFTPRCKANRGAVNAVIEYRLALVTSETGILPMRGKAYRLRLDIHSRW